MIWNSVEKIIYDMYHDKNRIKSDEELNLRINIKTTKPKTIACDKCGHRMKDILEKCPECGELIRDRMDPRVREKVDKRLTYITPPILWRIIYILFFCMVFCVNLGFVFLFCIRYGLSDYYMEYKTSTVLYTLVPIIFAAIPIYLFRINRDIRENELILFILSQVFMHLCYFGLQIRRLLSFFDINLNPAWNIALIRVPAVVFTLPVAITAGYLIYKIWKPINKSIWLIFYAIEFPLWVVYIGDILGVPIFVWVFL